MLPGVDFLTVWGVSSAVGFIFKPILEKLAESATGALEDYVKDFFSVCIKTEIDLAEHFSFKKAFGQAVKEFLEFVQLELQDNGLEDNQIEEYETYLGEFIRSENVLQQLGIPFQTALGKNQNDAETINIAELINTWNNLNLQQLPNDFNWQQLIKRYTRKVDNISRNSDELRKILDSRNLERMRQNSEDNAPILPNFDLSRYQQGIKNIYSKLKLDSLDTSGCNYTGLELWNIFVPQNLCEQADTKTDIISVLDIVNNPENHHQYTVILGNPGSGKSTFAQYRALQWARSQRSNLEAQELPLLIELRNYIENLPNLQNRNFLGYFEQGSGVLGGTLNQRQLDKWLRNYDSIVIFDGLDEVLDPATRENIAIDIINFTATYPKARVLVTSRVVGYEKQRQRFRDANFRHFMLQDLEIQQIEDFVTQWHKLTFTDITDRDRKCDRLLDCIRNTPTFRELAGNPLLLTMMAILNRHEELPRDRATFYEQAAQVLLHKWEAEGKCQADPSGLDYKDKKEILRRIAYQMQRKSEFSNHSKSLVITENALEKIITDYLREKEISNPYLNAKSLRQQLINRSFILCFLGGETYGFVHRTFLEYFCADHFIYSFEHEKKLSLEELKQQVLISHWLDDAWREVIVLIAGKIFEKFAAEFIEWLIEQNGQEHEFENLILASECLRNVRTRSLMKATDDKLLDAVKSLLENQPDITEEIRHKAQKAIEATWKDDLATLPQLDALPQ